VTGGKKKEKTKNRGEQDLDAAKTAQHPRVGVNRNSGKRSRLTEKRETAKTGGRDARGHQTMVTLPEQSSVLLSSRQTKNVQKRGRRAGRQTGAAR